MLITDQVSKIILNFNTFYTKKKNGCIIIIENINN